MIEEVNKKVRNIKYYQGVGRRKRAIARARLFSGTGKVSINGKVLDVVDEILFIPFKTVGLIGKYDVSLKITGGGIVSRKEAARMAISRALILVDSNYRENLRNAGLLTRDSREKERKKPGLKRARRAPQWQKR